MPYFIAWDDEIPAGDRDRVKNVLLCKRDSPPEEYIRKVSSAFSSMKEELLSGRWDVVILDEINVALYYKLISIKDVRELMDSKPEKVELVFTGRNIPEEIISRANLVSEIREVKHPYSSGVPARRGIDF